MAKFKNEQGGVCEVFSGENIEKLRKNKKYKEVTNETKKPEETKISEGNQEIKKSDK